MLNILQVLRGIAATSVAAFHGVPHYEAIQGESGLYSLVAGYGYTGVDIFFVISGYVMALTTVHKERNLKNATAFIQKRLFRIYLGYWPFFFIALLIALAFDRQKLSDIDLVASFFLTSPDMFRVILPVSWSLTYELFFYAIIFLLFSFNLKRAHGILVFTFLFVLAINLATTVALHPVSDFFFSPYILEFLSGYFLFLFFRTHRSRTVMIGFACLCVFGYALGFYLDAKHGFNRIYSFGVGAFGLVGLSILYEKKNGFKPFAPLSWLGDASYVIYLCHLPFFSLFYWLGIRDWLVAQGVFVAGLGFTLYFAWILIFSVAFHFSIEHRVYRWMLGRIGIRPTSPSYP